MTTQSETMTTTLQIERHTLITSATLSKGMATRLRGALADRRPDDVLLHHHDGDGSMIYLYPRVQYKVINHQAVILALEEGIEAARQALAGLKMVRLGDTEILIEGIESLPAEEPFGLCEAMIEYRFLTPWVALNQENARRFVTCNYGEARALLSKILIGNCLSMAKSFHYDVPGRIQADIRLRQVPVTLKGMNLLGFVGRVRLNFHLPDWIGLGKSVSRGFGALQRIHSPEESPCN